MTLSKKCVIISLANRKKLVKLIEKTVISDIMMKPKEAVCEESKASERSTLKYFKPHENKNKKPHRDRVTYTLIIFRSFSE